MRPIKVAWVNDIVSSLGRTPEEEAAEEFQMLQEILGYRLEMVARDRFVENVEQIDIDLLVFDYGGAASSYSDTPWTQLEAACRWAQEHPGRLVLLYSSFTGRMYEDLVKHEAYQELKSDNVMYWHLPGYGHTIRDEMKHQDQIKVWFTGGEFEPYDNPAPSSLKTPGRLT